MTTICQGRASWRGRTNAAILLAVGRGPPSAGRCRRTGERSRPVHRTGPRLCQRESPSHDGRRLVHRCQSGSAAQGALTNCVNNGGSHCVAQVIATNECAAAASNNYGERPGTGPSLAAAQRKARASCRISRAPRSSCPGARMDPPRRRRTTTAATAGAEAWADGLVRHGPGWPRGPHHRPQWRLFAVHTRRRTSTAAFALPANSRYDLRVVPAVPRFRNWTVTIACDNGTSTTTTTFF